MTSKMFKCQECGHEFTVLVGVCPSCGHQDQRPINWMNPAYRLRRNRATFIDKDHWTNEVRGVVVLEDCTLSKSEEAERRRKLDEVLY